MNETKMNQLKPCPFCGGKVRPDEIIKDSGIVVIECSNCGAMVTFDKEAEVINKWNSRHILTKQNTINKTDDLESRQDNNSDIKKIVKELESAEIINFAGIIESKVGDRRKVAKYIVTKNATFFTMVGYLTLWTSLLHELHQKRILNIDGIKSLNNLSTEFLIRAQIEDMNDDQLNKYIYDIMTKDFFNYK